MSKRRRESIGYYLTDVEQLSGIPEPLPPEPLPPEPLPPEPLPPADKMKEGRQGQLVNQSGRQFRQQAVSEAVQAGRQ